MKRIGIAAASMLLLAGCFMSGCSSSEDSRIELLELRIASLEKNQGSLIGAIRDNSSAIKELSSASEKNSDSIMILAGAKRSHAKSEAKATSVMRRVGLEAKKLGLPRVITPNRVRSTTGRT